jgi:8-amino-7-oxononanoate synthase
VDRTSTPIFGSAGSRLLDGTTPQHSALEDRLSSFFSYNSIPGPSSSASTDGDSALLFNSGFDANVSFFSTVPQKTDYIIFDELVHASVWDGMRANERRGVPTSRRRAFRHGDAVHLERILEKIVSAEQLAPMTSTPQLGMIFIAIESLYSMDGDLAPLPQIISALERLQTRHPLHINPARVCVVVDEAHTTGVYGSRGRGFVYDMVEREKAERGGKSRIAEWVQVRLMTFGKGMGSQGGKTGLCCGCQKLVLMHQVQLSSLRLQQYGPS